MKFSTVLWIAMEQPTINILRTVTDGKQCVCDLTQERHVPR